MMDLEAVLELDNGRRLSESGGILFYLSEGTPFLPDDRLARAEVLQWMFFEQYSHEPYVAVARFWLHHLEMIEEREKVLPEKHVRGHAALGVMERHLDQHDYFAAGRYTVADEGGFDQARYPALDAWLGRVVTHPGHIPIDQG
ncbi:MAG TPA: hypothetical protein QGG32_01655 [Rhodospirillales bacterium]|nr:hypothetical protein [Rhodospirillales bacterium]